MSRDRKKAMAGNVKDIQTHLDNASVDVKRLEDMKDGSSAEARALHAANDKLLGGCSVLLRMFYETYHRCPEYTELQKTWSALHARNAAKEPPYPARVVVRQMVNDL